MRAGVAASLVVVVAVPVGLSAVRALASDPPASYTLTTFAGPQLAEGVPALETNVWIHSLAAGPGQSLTVATYTDRGFVRVISEEGTLFTVAGKHARDQLENDGGLALETDLGQVNGLDVDGEGRIYACLPWDVVCRIDPDGRIHRIAGIWGQSGHSGEGVLAAESMLDFPRQVVVHENGTVYFAQRNRVSRIDPDGRLWTVAGDGTEQYGGVGDGGPATEASLVSPWGLALDALGRLYIADSFDGRVRMVDLEGTISTVAGDGDSFDSDGDGGLAIEASIGQATDIVLDAEGNIYISDVWNAYIRRVSPDGIISTIAGTGEKGYSGDGGPAIEAQLNDVKDIDIDSDGNLLLADLDVYRVRQIAPDGTITTIAGNGTRLFGGDGFSLSEACFGGPSDVAFLPSGTAYIADRINQRIRMWEPDGVVSTIAGTGFSGSSGDGGPANEASLMPTSIALSPNGELYLVDGAGNCVRRIDASGYIHRVAGNGDVGFNGDGIPAVTAQLGRVKSLDVGLDGTVYFVEPLTHRVRYVDSEGLIQTLCGTGVASSQGDGGPAHSASVNGPEAVHVAPDGTIYVAEYSGDRVRRISVDGIISTVAGTGESGYTGDGGLATNAMLSAPSGLVTDDSGSLYISSAGNYVVRRVLPNGTIETIAGTGGLDYLGEPLPALEAAIRGPWAMTLGEGDEIFVAAYGGGRIYRLTPDRGTAIAWTPLRARSLNPGRVTLEWTANSSKVVQYEVFRRDRGPWARVASLPGNGAGEVSYTESVPGHLPEASYRVDVMDGRDVIAQLGPVDVRFEIPGVRTGQLRAIPNPFNPRTVFEFTLQGELPVRLRIFDLAGRLVRDLMDEPAAGRVQREWDGADDDGRAVASGVYLAELRVDGVVSSRIKATLVR